MNRLLALHHPGEAVLDRSIGNSYRASSFQNGIIPSGSDSIHRDPRDCKSFSISSWTCPESRSVAMVDPFLLGTRKPHGKASSKPVQLFGPTTSAMFVNVTAAEKTYAGPVEITLVHRAYPLAAPSSMAGDISVAALATLRSPQSVALPPLTTIVHRVRRSRSRASAAHSPAPPSILSRSDSLQLARLQQEPEAAGHCRYRDLKIPQFSRGDALIG